MPSRLDLPVVWLGLAFGSVWALARWTGTQWAGWAASASGLILALAAGVLILWAVAVMRRARTAVMPGQVPSRLVTHGPFATSRNPIYLGMAVLLAAWALWLGTPVGLVLVPTFMTVLSKRFILDEEARLAATFGPEFTAWSARTGRWLGFASSRGPGAHG